MGWTLDQRRAIEARGENLLLSAAAGSGKTTVLVERVLSLIEEGASVDRMLIVTFSRAAAADMKAKLTASLARRAQERPDLAPQVEKVERASVCTLHAYCIEVLRGHFEAAGVDPAFRVLDEAENGQLKAHAMQQVLEEALSRPDEGLDALLYGRDLKALAQAILTLYEFAQARPDPEAWLDMALVQQPQGGGDLWRQALMRSAARQLDEAAALGGYALELAGQGPRAYEPALREDLFTLGALRAMEDYRALRLGLMGYAQGRLKPLRVREDDPDAEAVKALASQVKALRKEQKARLEKAVQLLPDLNDALADERALLPACQALKRLVEDFGRVLWDMKQDRSALTFGDLEHAALRSLQDERVARAQRARFAYVFVDEYQDVSDLQEALISRVAAAGNLFMVGDVKQSIYRFRQAEPTLFIDKYLRYGAGQGGRLISLSQNFRSRPTVLTLVNRVFERAMSGPDAELRYDEAARLNPGACFEGEDPPVEVCVLTAAPEGEEEEAELTRAQAEGAWVARRIKALLGTPFFDPGLKKQRPLRPGDIAVLSRTRSGLSACELMLRSEGVPCYLDASEGYFDALEVRVMLSLMQTVENRRRDFPLLAVLRSPIVGLSSTQLAQVRSAYPQGPFYLAVEAQLEKRGALADRLRAFDEQLARWRLLSRALPLAEWVDRVLMESGYYAYVGGMAGGTARQGNLDLLCAYASQFESSQSGGLTAFLEYVAEIGNTGGDMGAAHALGEGDDVVRLMTAHKSKGLEFPVVFAVQLGRALGGRRGAGEPCCHRLLGAGFYYNDPELGTRRDTLCRRAVRCVQEEESLEEEKRILYVLLTRAQERLILVGSEKSREEAELRWRVMAGAPLRPLSFLDMIMPALDSGARLYWQEGAAPAGKGEADAPRQEVDPELVDRMRRALTWRYPYEGEELTPLKLTASGLTREVVGPAAMPVIARRPSFLSERGLTAAERGTLIHAALSALDLERLRSCSDLDGEIALQLKALYRRNLIAQPLDPAPLSAFFRRDIGQRLLAAERVRREWPFNLRMTAREALGVDAQSDVVVQGVIDCCFLEGGAWVLLDYKTDRLDDGQLLERYRAQVALYRQALERITAVPVKQTLLCLLSAGREVEA